MGDDWLIRDARGNPDGLLLWWGPNRAGYTTNLDEAGRYSREDAERQASSRATDVAVPLSKAMARARTVTAVEATLGNVFDLGPKPTEAGNG